MKKFFKKIIVLLICSSFITSCSQNNLPLHQEQLCVNLETANKYYKLSAYNFSLGDCITLKDLIDVTTRDPDLNGEIKPNDLISIDKYYYCDINILNNRDLKLRMYFEKEEPNLLWNTVYIYESLIDTDVLFSIGDSATDIDEEYQKIEHLSENLLTLNYNDYFFDVVNNLGWYRYYCKNNTIVEVKMILENG